LNVNQEIVPNHLKKSTDPSPHANKNTTLGTAYDLSTHREGNSRFTFIKLPNEDENGDERAFRKSNSVGHLSGPILGQSIRQPTTNQDDKIYEDTKRQYEQTPNFKVNNQGQYYNSNPQR
jgi:hypothetical protein